MRWNEPNPEVSQLVDSLVEHRQRVVQQVAGVPLASLKALAATRPHFASDLVADNPALAGMVAEASPQRSAFRHWLETQVKKSFVAQTFYESSTAWGRENARLAQQREEERLSTPESLGSAQKTLEADIRARVDQAMAWTRDERRFLADTDAQILSRLVQLGHFENPPVLVYPTISQADKGPSAISEVGGAVGMVSMPSDRMGDFFHPLVPPAELGIAHEVAHQWAAGDEPDRLMHVERVYDRWLTLFHEVAHCQESHSPNPLQPSAHPMDAESVAAINDWMVGGLALVPRKSAEEMLDECNADVRAAMMLLEVTNHDPVAMKVVQNFQKVRIRDRFDTDMEVVEDLAAGKELGRGALRDPHATDFAVKRALRHIDLWKGMDAQSLKRAAQTFASDGFLDYLSPTRGLKHQKPFGLVAAETIIPHKIEAKDLLERLERLAHSHASTPGSVEKWFSTQNAQHPTYALLKQSWDSLRPGIDEILAPSPAEGKPANSHTKAVRMNEALVRMVEFVRNAELPTKDPMHPLFQQAQEGLVASHAAIRRGLRLVGVSRLEGGVQSPTVRVDSPEIKLFIDDYLSPPTAPPAPPSLETASVAPEMGVSAWRAARAAKMTPPMAPQLEVRSRAMP